MENLKGKRLLVLGGSMWKDAIKAFTKQHEITFIAAGLYHAGIFDVADESYIVDTVDADVMKKFVKDHQIDGVYMGGSEFIIRSACKWIGDIGLPCYCTSEQWELLQDKGLFKNLCLKHGIPCVPRYQMNSDNIAFPVITKPTDGCGSCGFSVYRDKDELKVGYEKAFKESPTGSVIIEKFVKNDGVVVYYTIDDGKLVFSGLQDKFPVKYATQGSYVAGMHVWESEYKEEFRDRFEKKLEKMAQSIGLKSGSFWIEVFHEGDNYYFNEVGFRYSGSVSIYPVDYFYGINQVGADIYYALTGNNLLYGHSCIVSPKVPKKQNYCVLNLHMKPGTIGKIEGLEEIRNLPECVFIADTKHVGDKVKSTGTVAQVFAFVHFVFDGMNECKKIAKKIFNTIHVNDDDGNEMICNMLDWESPRLIAALEKDN